MDGTFSIVGEHHKGAARVVSKHRVSLHKDPIVEPYLPSLNKSEIEQEKRKRSQMEDFTDKPIPQRPITHKRTTHKPTMGKPAANPEELWKYICNTIDRDLVKPAHTLFDRLLALPRVRDLNIIDKELSPKHFMHSTLAAGLVIQLTGVERKTKMCTACRRGDGPFHECVCIVPELANEVAEANPPLVTSTSNRWCCMNCVVNKHLSQCSLKASSLERTDDGGVKENIPHWMVDKDSAEQPSAIVVKKTKEASQDVSVDEESNSSYRRSGRIRLQASSVDATKPAAAESHSQKRSFASTDMAPSQVAAAVSQEEEEISSLALRTAKRIRGIQSPANVTPSTIQESMMVEDWEREGRVISRGNGADESKYFQLVSVLFIVIYSLPPFNRLNDTNPSLPFTSRRHPLNLPPTNLVLLHHH